ncbi:WD40 repeat domain-containing protein [Blastopirellula marina]|nr:WD40 repeat domain-containing protein [Blastopirellula marina]
MNRRATALLVFASIYFLTIPALAEEAAEEAEKKEAAPISVWCLDFSPDGTMLAAAAGNRDQGGEGTVRVWNTKNWEEVLAIRDEKTSTCVAFSPDGASLAVGTNHGEIFTVDIASKKVSKRWKSGQWGAFGVTWTPDGQKIVGALANGSIKVFDAKSTDVLVDLDVWKADRVRNTNPGGHADKNQWDVTVTADGKTLFSGGWQDTARVWSLETSQLLEKFPDDDRSTQGIQLTPDERYMVTAGIGSGKVNIRDTVTFRLRMSIPVSGRDVAVHPDGELIAACRPSDVHVYRVNLEPLAPEVALRARAYLKELIVADPKEQEEIAAKLIELGPSIEPILHFAVLEDKGPVEVLQALWNKARTPEKVAELGQLPSEIRQVVFSPAGDLLAAANTQGEIQIWDVPNFNASAKLIVKLAE